MADAAISFAVQKLGGALIQKVKFLKGVEEEVQWLKDELQTMQCFLKDAAEKQGSNERIRKWISDIREVAQDAEDAIETFLLKVDIARRNRGLMGRCASFPAHVSNHNRAGKEIESIRKRLENIQNRRQKYGIQNLGEGTSTVLSRRSEDVERRRRLVPWQKDKHLVGLEEDVKLLLQESILNEEKKGLSIATIVGMGGIGKSTLARKIYNHAAVAAEFECRAWVVVSSEFAHADIIKQIMLQLQNSTEDKPKLLDTMKKLEESISDKLVLQEMLREMLHKQLVGKRYFIVLDDVWEQTHWESMRNAFPDEQDQTSRLLLTSRNQIITKHLGYIHKMRLLNSDESWELLLKTAFLGKNDGKCPLELESIGREILKKCHGLPLAIMVAGGLLVNEGESKSGWEEVLKQIKDYHLETSEISSNVSGILESSYHNLPPRLKACFLCLGFFKEDVVIRARTLVHIWVALDFISSEEVGREETMEKIAMSYLDELISRNLVQVKDISVDDQVKKCHVHDLLRELSIRKAKEEIGLEILREGNSSVSSFKPRHRVYQYCNGKRIMLDSSSQNKHVRSLFFHDVDRSYVNYASTSSYWKSLGLLRILYIGDIRLTGLPSKFRVSLIGLRYLRLRVRGSMPLELPRWLDHLKNLEVLDVANGIAKLPDVEWKIDSLHHFYACSITGSPMNIYNWKNLETLKNISAENWMPVENPEQMASCRVRILGIVVEEWTELSRVGTSLEKMEKLVQLHLKRNTFDYSPASVIPIPLDRLHHLTKLKISGKMIHFRTASELPQNLSHLTLKWSNIMLEDPMPELGKLPKLLFLKLNEAYKGAEMRVLHDGFPSLKVLFLQRMNDVRCIHIEEGGMPELQRFEIHDCPRLTTHKYLPEHVRSSAATTINSRIGSSTVAPPQHITPTPEERPLTPEEAQCAVL